MSAQQGMLLGLPERWDEACFAAPAVRALEKSGLIGGLALRKEQAEFWRTVSGLPQVVFSEKTQAGKLAMDLLGEWEASLVWEDGILAKAFAKAGIARRLGSEKSVPRRLLTNPLDIAEGGTVLLCPGSDFGKSHEWPLERWQELGEALRAEGRRITVAGVDGGRGLGKMLAERLGIETGYFDAEPLAEALPLLAVHELTVAADGSLPHLAAHAGSTCVTLFGPNDAVWKRPLGKRHKVVKRHVECAPCLSAKCLFDGRCQTELEVARVMAAVRESSGF